ncbi:MAG TPA: hypothetical protein VFJ51_06580 [Nitrososphaeraceae archaeon]|nr:hypothetical protein [Nitrososphaeraceae archaeon]
MDKIKEAENKKMLEIQKIHDQAQAQAQENDLGPFDHFLWLNLANLNSSNDNDGGGTSSTEINQMIKSLETQSSNRHTWLETFVYPILQSFS